MLPQRTCRLPQQQLRVATDHEVRELAHRAIAKPLVQPARAGIERRRADEHVRLVAEDALLRERDERRAEAASAPVVANRDGLDVADERALHDEDDEPGDARLAIAIGIDR